MSNRQQTLTLIVTTLALSITILDSTVVSVALPAIRRDLGLGLSGQQWIVDGYLLTLGSLIIISGSLGDLFGRKRLFIIGLIGFGVTSLACALSRSEAELVVARLFQGMAGALLIPSTLAILVVTFTGAARGRAIGRWAGWAGVASALGPLVGGFLVQSLSWQTIFYINLPIIAVVLPLSWVGVASACDRLLVDRKLDLIGAVLIMVGLGCLVFGLIEGPTTHWSNTLTLVVLAVGVCLLIGFVYHEHHTAAPMVPLTIFKQRNFGFGNLATFTIYAALTSTFIFVSIFLQSVVHYSPLEAGASLMPTTIMMLLFSPTIGQLSVRTGPRLPMTVGPLIAAVGLLLFTTITPHSGYWSTVFPGALIFGCGLTITVAPLTNAVMSAVSEQRLSLGSAINNAVARIGGLLAVALAGVLIGGASALTTGGFRLIVILNAALCVAGGLISAYGIRTMGPESKR